MLTGATNRRAPSVDFSIDGRLAYAFDSQLADPIKFLTGALDALVNRVRVIAK
jgi:hypothetical protein